MLSRRRRRSAVAAPRVRLPFGRFATHAVRARVPRRVGGALVLAGLLVVLGLVTPRALRAIGDAELFRVSRVELEGGRFLTLEQAATAAAIPAEASVWDDRSPWVAGLERHPLVKSARVRRRLPSTLVLVVEEREPVGLVPTPTLAPVDEEGNLLPLDPSRQALDLPLLGVAAPATRAPASAADSAAAAEATRAARAALAAETARLGRIDPEFAARISELSADEQGGLIARWGEPAVAFRFRPRVPARRLREGVLALEDAMRTLDGTSPQSIDLRFAEQVVVRRGS